MEESFSLPLVNTSHYSYGESSSFTNFNIFVVDGKPLFRLKLQGSYSLC